jgi:hypothetical protein
VSRASTAALPEMAVLHQLEQSVGNGHDDHEDQDDALPWLQFTPQTHDADDCQHDDHDEYEHSRRFYICGARIRRQ